MVIPVLTILDLAFVNSGAKCGSDHLFALSHANTAERSERSGDQPSRQSVCVRADPLATTCRSVGRASAALPRSLARRWLSAYSSWTGRLLLTISAEFTICGPLSPPSRGRPDRDARRAQRRPATPKRPRTAPRSAAAAAPPGEAGDEARRVTLRRTRRGSGRPADVPRRPARNPGSMRATDPATPANQTGERVELRCPSCGYGIVVNGPPPACPICRSHAWDLAPRARREAALRPVSARAARRPR